MGIRKRQRDGLTRNKERASMSFFIVIMFFAVFVVIVVTEVLLMDERGNRGAGVLVRRGSIIGVSHRRAPDKPDYEDFLKTEDDYLTYRGGNGIINDQLSNNKIKEDKREAALKRAMLDNVRNMPRVGMGQIPNANDLHHSHKTQPLMVEIENQFPQINSNFTAKDGTWQVVNGTRAKFFVFSAFYDRRRTQKSIRIIGATRTRPPERVWCRFWYDTSSKPTPQSSDNNSNSTTKPQTPTSLTILAKIKIIRENWNLKYSACFVLCPITKFITEIPTSVSIVSKLRYHPGNHLIVKNTDKEVNVTNIPKGLGVCVKPIHFNYNQAIKMLEFLELNSLLGVTHFTFYNHTVGPEVDCLLKEYQRNAVASHMNNNNNTSIGITILPWQLDMVSQIEIRTEGLFAALNDCLYRNMYRYSHLALIDLDEYIMPKFNDTLMELIEWMSTRMNTQNTGSYSFQNIFFYLQWEDDVSIFTTKDKVEASMITLKKTRRRTKLHPHKQRSKYICRPELVIEAGNHFVWEFVPGQGTLNMPAYTASLHHYRVCEFGGDDCVKTSSVIDHTTYRYKSRLIDRVTKQYWKLKDQCHLSNLPDIPKKPDKPKKPVLVKPNMIFRKTIQKRS